MHLSTYTHTYLHTHTHTHTHTNTGGNKWRNEEKLREFIKNPFSPKISKTGPVEFFFPDDEPGAAFIAFSDARDLSFFSRFRQQLIGGSRVKLEVVRRPNSFPRIELKAVRGIEIHVYIDTL